MSLAAAWVLGSLGAWLLLFAAFVLLRARTRAAEPRASLDVSARRAAWATLAVGAVAFLAGLLG